MSRGRVVARAPGRVNLIGEHTDYNDGFVLPMALPFATTIEAEARTDSTVRLRSEGYTDVDFDLRAAPSGVEGWARYVAGMVAFTDHPVGFDAVISSTIPIGASLSSSAALEVATGFALARLRGEEPDPVAIARLGQRVENEVIGIQSGIMDQLASACAVAGHAVCIDCRDLSVHPVPVPAGATVVIMDTMTRRELAESAYDDRRAACERAAADIGVPALRDATLDDLERVVDPTDRRRARHVITENARVVDAVAALTAGDLERVGDLMNAGHASIRADFEVSSEALDRMVDVAREHPGCLGARMTGGGFAGCAVALVRREAADSFLTHTADRYEKDCAVRPDLWTVDPSAGASVETI